MNRRKLLQASTAIAAAGPMAGAAAAPAAAARPAREVGSALRVHVVMYDGVEELDFAAPWEVFSAARFFTDREIDVRYVTASGPGAVQAAYGTRVRVEHGWSPRTADVLVVPGGGYARRDAPGVRRRSHAALSRAPWLRPCAPASPSAPSARAPCCCPRQV